MAAPSALPERRRLTDAPAAGKPKDHRMADNETIVLETTKGRVVIGLRPGP